MIEVKNLTRQFDDILAVDNISFRINVGEITGFLGPNGAGKSTTLKMLSSYLKPTSGEIFYNDQKMSDIDYDIRRDIGYLPELNPLYYDLLVYDYLKFMAELKEIKKESIDERIRYVAQRCGIVDRLPQMIGTLSKGYKQRVGLAQAILSDPKILILDEPTNGLDPNQIIEIRTLISELGKDKTVILSSHILQEIQAICERILIIHKGKLITDTTKEELLTKIKQKNVLRLSLNGHIDPLLIGQIDDSIMVTYEKTKNGIGKYTIEYPVEKDFREEIFNTIVQNKGNILELYQETQNLEDVFTLLTGNDAVLDSSQSFRMTEEEGRRMTEENMDQNGTGGNQ